MSLRALVPALPSRATGSPLREKRGWVLAAIAIFGIAVAAGRAAEPKPGAAILQDLRSFNTTGTLLHIAAHPDDENTALITYFARGRGYRTAYLSLTRGDGGQNEIGPEFDEKLGLARTQELLAARKLDGGRQFFTRAIDFGFSKTAEETLQFWDRDQVLSDVVRVIRIFRPDVIVTRFSPTSSGSTHGHHTASGILGQEAFRLAGDPKAYPEQLTQGLTVWQAKRVVLNAFGPGGRGGGQVGRVSDPPSGAARSGSETRPTALTVDIGGTDPVNGESFGAIAGRSRAMHITQGFANFAGRGGGSGPNEQTFTLLAGEPAQKDLFDGIDTTWARFPGGAEIGRLTTQAIAAFNPDRPSASVPALLAIRARLAAWPKDPVIDDKRAQLDRILQACLGLRVRSVAQVPEVVPGERLEANLRVRVDGDVPIRFAGLRAWGGSSGDAIRELNFSTDYDLKYSAVVPLSQPLTQPYWLRQQGSSGIARVDDPKLIGQPENPAAFVIDYQFEVGGQTLTVSDDLVHVTRTEKGERRRRVDVIPPVSLSFVADVSVIAPGGSRHVLVEATAARGGINGTLQLDLPVGWKASPASQPLRLENPGDRAKLGFTVSAPAQAATASMTASATVGGNRYSTQRITIDYAHLPLMLLQPPAKARLLSLEVATRGRNVGYLPGAGDDTAEALAQLGYNVTVLSGPDLGSATVRGLDAIVIGVRAFNERKDLAANLPALWNYVENGGTVIAQYNRPGGSLPALGPYELSITGPAPQLRVTDEKAPVSFLAAEHPALTTPNLIRASDFDGWVQERGAYFPSKWDEQRYIALLAMSDPGEAPLRSSVLIAKHGRGHYVYTGLAFFRQLPAGVPGAYRLFANLVSLGK